MSLVEAVLQNFSLDQLLFGTQESIPLHLEASTTGVDKIDLWWKGVRQEFKVLKPYTESLFISAFFVKQMFFVYSLGSLALWYPSQSLSIYLQGLLASILIIKFLWQSVMCVVEILGTTLITMFFAASHNRADPYVDEVIEPIMLGVSYLVYILYVSPSMFYNGVLFGLMEAAKPANSIFMMYLPMVLQGWFGLGDHEMFPVQIAYFGLELLLTGVPQVLFLTSSALAAVEVTPGPNDNVDPTVDPVTPTDPVTPVDNTTTNSNSTSEEVPVVTPTYVLYY